MTRLWRSLTCAVAILAAAVPAAGQDAARQALEPATRAVLERALGEPGLDQLRAFEELAERPDWQAVVDLLVDEIRSAPGDSQNDRALAIEFIAKRRLREIRIDVGPLISLLATRSWTNQQKAAQAIAALAPRADLFAGRERDTVHALVPLTTSQRGRVVDAALASLTQLTGQAFGRDPIAWSEWAERTWGERVPLDDAVYELLAVIRRREGPAGALEFSLNGGPWSTAEALIAPYRELQRRAAESNVSVEAVLVVPTISFEKEALLAQVDPLRPLFREVQPEELTFSPESDVFYPPWVR